MFGLCNGLERVASLMLCKDGCRTVFYSTSVLSGSLATRVYSTKKADEVGRIDEITHDQQLSRWIFHSPRAPKFIEEPSCDCATRLASAQLTRAWRRCIRFLLTSLMWLETALFFLFFSCLLAYFSASKVIVSSINWPIVFQKSFERYIFFVKNS